MLDTLWAALGRLGNHSGPSKGILSLLGLILRKHVAFEHRFFENARFPEKTAIRAPELPEIVSELPGRLPELPGRVFWSSVRECLKL